MLGLIRRVGYERVVLSESKFTDIVKNHDYAVEEQRRYTTTGWRDMFVSVGLRVDIVEQPDTIVDTGLVGE